MKQQLNSFKLPFVFILSAFIFFACEKEAEVKKDEIPASSMQQSEDADEQTEATDDVIDIATNAFTSSNMRIQSDDDTCHMTSQWNQTERSVTFTFNGDNCAGTRTRTGTVVAKVTSEVHWHEQGGTVEVTFTNFKVTRKSDGKSIVINGTYVVYNNSGIANPYVQTLHGDFTIKFDNNAVRVWKVSRKRTISLNDTVIQVKIESDSSNFVTEVGVNREGNAFVTTIPDAVVIQNCSSGPNGYKAIRGEIVYTVGTAALSVELGYKSLSEKVEDCSATGSVVTYTDPTTMAKKYYPYK